MSIYEVLAVAALLAAGGFAWKLYRADVKSGADRTPQARAGQKMFSRDKPKP
jgi:hypothetical protein